MSNGEVANEKKSHMAMKLLKFRIFCLLYLPPNLLNFVLLLAL